MKVSQSYVTQIPGKNLSNQYYQDRLAEQREQRQQQAASKTQRVPAEMVRNVSCSSHNQKISNPNKQFSYVSGKPKQSIGQ